MKNMMKQFIIGGIAGFFGAIFTLMIINDITINQTYIFIGLAALITLFILFSIISTFQIKAAVKKEVTGDEEDELDRKLYVKSSDVGMVINSAIVLTVILISMTVVKQMHYAFVLLSILLAVISIGLQYYQAALFKQMYPERDMPSINDPDYAEKLVNIADEGERFVMLQGMMKAFNMYTLLLILGIIFSTIYSVFSADGQMFSITLMGLILIISNTVYFLTIRKKA